MKILHFFFPVLSLFVLSCSNKREEPIAIVVEPIQPKMSVTLIIDNPVNSSMLVKTMGDDSKTYTANLPYDTIRIFTDTPKMLYIEQNMFIWHKMTVEPNDTIIIRTEKNAFRILADQQKRTWADIHFFELADSLARIEFKGVENVEYLFYEPFPNAKSKKQEDGLINLESKGFTGRMKQKSTSEILENKAEFRRIFDSELEIYQFKLDILDSLNALNELRVSSYEYYKDELFFRVLYRSLFKHKRSGDSYFETYLLNHLNDDLLTRNDYGLLDSFLSSFIPAYILQGQFEIKGNSAIYDYKKALEEMPNYFSGDVLRKLNSRAIELLIEQSPDIDLFKDLAQDVKLDSGSKALLTEQIEDMIDADRLQNLSEDSLYLTSLNKDLHSFEKILESSKTELVLIDLWASWCGPCFRHFPTTSELEKQYSGKLTVIYISLDDYKSKWLQGAERAGLKGKNSFLSVNPRESKTLTEAWGVTALPRFILMNKSGEIISKHAPSPESREMEELIETNPGG
ncbi:MAG: thioredoxin-like domain-containing protein [Bacteroidota bacterium]|nr:thioredoxin-like domain-containing protein [Bacteroidota bacterium]